MEGGGPGEAGASPTYTPFFWNQQPTPTAKEHLVRNSVKQAAAEQAPHARHLHVAQRQHPDTSTSPGTQCTPKSTFAFAARTRVAAAMLFPRKRRAPPLYHPHNKDASCVMLSCGESWHGPVAMSDGECAVRASARESVQAQHGACMLVAGGLSEASPKVQDLAQHRPRMQACQLLLRQQQRACSLQESAECGGKVFPPHQCAAADTLEGMQARRPVGEASSQAANRGAEAAHEFMEESSEGTPKPQQLRASSCTQAKKHHRIRIPIAAAQRLRMAGSRMADGGFQASSSHHQPCIAGCLSLRHAACQKHASELRGVSRRN